MKFRRMTLNAMLLCSLLSICSSCNGQASSQNTQRNVNTPHVTIAAGDTVSETGKGIWYIFQDRNNNFWFGSNGEGVYRYDGKTMIQFTTKDGLCHNQVRGIQEDSSGNIYINTSNGISQFDGQSFRTLKITSTKLPDDGWRLTDDDLWFQGTQDSGVVYRYDGKDLHRLTFPETKAGKDFTAKFPRSAYPQMTFSPYDLYSIYRDRKGSLWFGTNMGVCRYDGKTFAWISEKELGIDAISFHVRSTIEDKNGDFWFSNTMHRFDINLSDTTANEKGSINYKIEKGIDGSSKYNAADFAYFMSGIEHKGDLWLVTYNKGVWRYDGKNITHYDVRDGSKNIITLFSIYKDKKGELWLGTHDAGVYKFKNGNFEKFKP